MNTRSKLKSGSSSSLPVLHLRVSIPLCYRRVLNYMTLTYEYVPSYSEDASELEIT